MVLKALSRVGGVRYLMKQAELNPVAFMTLVGKVLPLQVTGAGGGPILTRVIHEDWAEEMKQLEASGTIDVEPLSPRIESESTLSPSPEKTVSGDQAEAKGPPND